MTNVVRDRAVKEARWCLLCLLALSPSCEVRDSTVKKGASDAKPAAGRGKPGTFPLPELTVPPQESLRLPVGLCLVPETDYISEVDTWPSCSDEYLAEHKPRFQSRWREIMPWVQKLVTPELVRALSQWAKDEMAGYDSVPPLDGLVFDECQANEEHRKMVFGATVDTLPSHSPVVTRWLRLYLLYDADSWSIIRVTVTIRGQRLE